METRFFWSALRFAPRSWTHPAPPTLGLRGLAAQSRTPLGRWNPGPSPPFSSHLGVQLVPNASRKPDSVQTTLLSVQSVFPSTPSILNSLRIASRSLRNAPKTHEASQPPRGPKISKCHGGLDVASHGWRQAHTVGGRPPRASTHSTAAGDLSRRPFCTRLPPAAEGRAHRLASGQ